MPAPESLASVFFRSLTADKKAGFKLLRSLAKVGSPYRESEWIEYKSGFYRDLNKDIGPEWSKQLSGFANAGDGLIIWGIQTKTIKKYDIPSSVSLTKDAVLLAGELERMKGYAVEPHVHGVNIDSFPNRKGEGFVVAYVPESNRKPHQVRFNDVTVQDRFYIRNGHTTEPIRPSLLRILFHPEHNPQLELTFQSLGYTGDVCTVHLHLKNAGTVTVSDLAVVVTDQGRDIYFVPSTDNLTRYALAKDALGYNAKNPLHPEYQIFLGMTVLRPQVNFWINVYGKDMKPFRWKAILNAEGKYEFVPVP